MSDWIDQAEVGKVETVDLLGPALQGPLQHIDVGCILEACIAILLSNETAAGQSLGFGRCQFH